VNIWRDEICLNEIVVYMFNTFLQSNFVFFLEIRLIIDNNGAEFGNEMNIVAGIEIEKKFHIFVWSEDFARLLTIFRKADEWPR
jgi:hypothetical protein